MSIPTNEEIFRLANEILDNPDEEDLNNLKEIVVTFSEMDEETREDTQKIIKDLLSIAAKGKEM